MGFVGFIALKAVRIVLTADPPLPKLQLELNNNRTCLPNCFVKDFRNSVRIQSNKYCNG